MIPPSTPPEAYDSSVALAAFRDSAAPTTPFTRLPSCAFDVVCTPSRSFVAPHLSPALHRSRPGQIYQSDSGTRQSFVARISVKGMSATPKSSSSAVKPRGHPSSTWKHSSAESCVSVDQGTPIKPFDLARENDPAILNTSTSASSALMPAEIAISPSARLPPKSPGKPSATSLSLTPLRTSDRIASPVSDRAVTPHVERGSTDEYWEELDLHGSEKVLVSGPERPSIVSQYVLSSPSMPEVFKSRSANITSPIFFTSRASGFQKQRITRNVPESPPEVRVNPLASDPEGEAALPPGIIPEIVHEVEFGLHYGFEEAADVDLGCRAMRVPLPYAINIRVVEIEGEICPASAKLEITPDCPNSMLLSVISGSINFESDMAGGYEDVVLTFWAAPDTSVAHSMAGLLLTVMDVDGNQHETTLQLSAEGTEPMITVERPRLHSRNNRQDTQIMFNKGEGTEEELVTVWNETKHDAPLLINVVVTDSGRGVFNIGRDSDDHCECISTTIPACSAVSFVIRFERSKVETLRNFYHGTILIKLGSIFPKGVYSLKSRNFNLAFDHVLSLQAKGTDGSCENVNTADTILDSPSQTVSEAGTRVYSESTREECTSPVRSTAPPQTISTPSQANDVAEEALKGDVKLDTVKGCGTVSGGSELCTEVVDFEPLDVLVSACGLEPVPEGIDQGPLYEGVFNLLDPVEWVLCETSEDVSEDNEIQHGNSDSRNLGGRAPILSGQSARRQSSSHCIAVSTKPTGANESSEFRVPPHEIREWPQLVRPSTHVCDIKTKQSDVELGRLVPSKRATDDIHQVAPGGVDKGEAPRSERMESAVLSHNTVKSMNTERRSSPCRDGQEVSKLAGSTPFGKLVGYADELVGSRTSERTPFGKLVGYSPDVNRLGSLSFARKLEFFESNGKCVQSCDDSETEFKNIPSHGNNRLLSPKLQASSERAERMGTVKGWPAAKRHLGEVKGNLDVLRSSLGKASPGRTKGAVTTDWNSEGYHAAIRGRNSFVNASREDFSSEVRRSNQTSGKPPLRPRCSSTLKNGTARSCAGDQRVGDRRNQTSLGTFISGGTIRGDTSLSSGGEITKHGIPKLRLPRKIRKNGVLLAAGVGSVLLPLCSGSRFDMEIDILVKPGDKSGAIVRADPTFLVLRPGQEAQVVFNRHSAMEGRMNVFLVCRSLNHPENVTSYLVPLTVEDSAKRCSSEHFSIDRPTLTFYNPDESSRRQRIRVFNDTSRREAVQIWIGPSGEHPNRDVSGAVFELVSHSDAFLEPQTSLNVDVYYNGWGGTEYHYEDLNIRMGSQVETVQIFGYSGGSDIQMDLTEDKVLRARNVGERYGFVLITGPDHHSGDAFAEKAVLAPGEELEFEAPYGSGSLIYTGDEIARKRFCIALITSPSTSSEDEEREKLFSDWFQGQEKAATAENLEFSGEPKYTLHYASRMFYVGLRQFAFDSDHERIVPVPGSERSCDQNWRASIDHDGFVHISNNDPKESLVYEMEGADPERGIIPPLGDSRNVPYREIVTARSQGTTVELSTWLNATKRQH